MASIFTDAQKLAIEADFQNLVDTFLRPLTVYQEAQRTVITSNPNFNPIEAWNQNSTTIQNTPVYTTISGRIMWDKQQEWKYVKPGGLSQSQLKVKDQTDRAVRLKVDYSGYSLLANAKKVQIDGVLCDPQSEPRQHGVFGTGFWTFYYVRSS